ncbi:MAG: hypothetical protein ACOZQL_09880 [Myxococcota bacterium]
MRLAAALLSLTLFACGTTAPTVPEDAGTELDAAVELPDAGVPDAGHKADACASEFGALFTNAFGRADGTVTAVVPPAWQCPLPNGDHVVIQVRIDGGVQRLVVNVQSSYGDPNIRFRAVEAPLPAPAWEEGWHPGLTLDYPSAFGVHSDAGWESLTLEQASARVYDAITVGAPLSVYASSSGGSYAASAHKIHRNGQQNDGAIVIDPGGAHPTWLLFHFANQTF